MLIPFRATRRFPALSVFPRFSFTALCGTLLVAVPAVSSLAFPAFLAAIHARYAPAAAEKIDSAKCGLCHVSTTGGGRLNLYGNDIKTALRAAHSSTLTDAVLKTVEARDSDGDGFSNIAELRNDTLPGDPASHPAGPAPATYGTAPEAAPEELSPFDIKAALLQKDAQHPILIHFPIALLVVSLVFEVIGRLRRSEGLKTASYYNLVGAAVTSIFAVVTGILAWQLQFQGAMLTGNLLKHLVLGIMSTVMIWTLWWLRVRRDRNVGGYWHVAYAVVAVMTVVVITLTGHIGGILSGVVTG